MHRMCAVAHLYGRAGDDALGWHPSVGEHHITADLQAHLTQPLLIPCTPMDQVVEAAAKGDLQSTRAALLTFTHQHFNC